MKNKAPISRSKALIFWIVGLTLFLLILLIPCEIITRVVTKKTNFYYKKAAYDDHLGWRTNSNYSVKSQAHVKDGDPYPVLYKTGEHGFRPYGNINTDKKKLLVVGDSYTQAVEANNGKIYSDLLAEATNTELFCYGQAGYGTTQQYLLIKEIIDTIEPDLVILQVCENDFMDNYAPLERASNYKVGERRPYMDLKGKISYYKPTPPWQSIIDKSAFLKLLRKKIQNSITQKITVSAQQHITDQGQGYEPYKTSIDITNLALKKIKALVDEKQIPIVAIMAGYTQPYIKDMEVICNQNNITCLTQPAYALRKLEGVRQPVRCADQYHWTELGHQVIADNMLDTIVAYLNPNLTTK